MKNWTPFLVPSGNTTEIGVSRPRTPTKKRNRTFENETSQVFLFSINGVFRGGVLVSTSKHSFSSGLRVTNRRPKANIKMQQPHVCHWESVSVRPSVHRFHLFFRFWLLFFWFRTCRVCLLVCYYLFSSSSSFSIPVIIPTFAFVVFLPFSFSFFLVHLILHHIFIFISFSFFPLVLLGVIHLHIFFLFFIVHICHCSPFFVVVFVFSFFSFIFSSLWFIILFFS